MRPLSRFAILCSLLVLGVLAQAAENPMPSEEALLRAKLQFQIKQDPGSLAVAGTLSKLGLAVRDRGDLEDAHRLFEEALDIRKRLARGTVDMAVSLTHMGFVSRDRGDLKGAQAYLEQALIILEKQDPNSRQHASALYGLGGVAQDLGNLDRAQLYYEDALAIQEKRVPGSLDFAWALQGVGAMARLRKDLDKAQRYFEQALAIWNEKAPGSPAMAHTLRYLAFVAKDRGRLVDAQHYFEQARSIQERIAPGSLALALVADDLGSIAQRRGNLEEAQRHYEQAWRLTQAQAWSIRGDDARQAFGRATAFFGAHLLVTQLEVGEAEAAFRTLEEGRAQSMLQHLQTRDQLRRLAPPNLWQAYADKHDAYGRSLKAYESAAAAETAAAALRRDAIGVDEVMDREAVLAQRREALRTQTQHLTEARLEMERAWTTIHRAVANQGASVGIEAADPGTARHRLPPGTLFAAFAVAERETILFLARREGAMTTLRIPLPAEAVANSVQEFRRAVAGVGWERRGTSLVYVEGRPVAQAALVTLARELYRKLFPPEARALLKGAERVVLSPDGPLWELPFAALVTNEAGEPEYLGLQQQIGYAPSLTLYVHGLTAPAPPPAAPGGKLSALVVGNPLFDNRRRAEVLAKAAPVELPEATGEDGKRAAGELVFLSRTGCTPKPLPNAEREALAVAPLYGGRAATGVEPTEAWFRKEAPAADLIHLATHGYYHPYQAANSGLWLAVPEAHDPQNTEDDAALQAWELTTLRLKADLVVLSACETGLGAKVTGEGLVGLTRAWQIAGARSVVASQWQVADASTKDLMVRFHRELRAGKAKDTALREAMRAVAGRAETSHPYHWAAFLLVGDPENRRLRAQ